VTSQADIANAMQSLELPEQVAVLEGLVAEVGIEQSADIISLHLLSVMLDLDGGQYPANLVARAERLKEQVRVFNEGRFGATRQ
jgi:hypothetical protein